MAGEGAAKKLRTEAENRKSRAAGDLGPRWVETMTSDRLDRLGVCSQPGLPQLGEQALEGDSQGSWDKAFREPAEK